MVLDVIITLILNLLLKLELREVNPANSSSLLVSTHFHAGIKGMLRDHAQLAICVLACKCSSYIHLLMHQVLTSEQFLFVQM